MAIKRKNSVWFGFFVRFYCSVSIQNQSLSTSSENSELHAIASLHLIVYNVFADVGGLSYGKIIGSVDISMITAYLRFMRRIHAEIAYKDQ